MTQYKTDFPFPIVSKPQVMDDVLAEWLGKQNVEQVHVAETEKYAHVTFFFNGGIEKVFPLETRDENQDLVPSNKSVATYDQAPEMSQDGVAEQVNKRMGEKKFPFVMCVSTRNRELLCRLRMMLMLVTEPGCSGHGWTHRCGK